MLLMLVYLSFHKLSTTSKKVVSLATLPFNYFLTDKRTSDPLLWYQGSFCVNALFKQMLNKITRIVCLQTSPVRS